jgi:glycosyltransferase involved in cell wall biosynthesis
MTAPRPKIVCFPFVGDGVGGSHLSALGLIQNLDRSLFEPLVVLHQTEGPLAAYLKKEGIPFVVGPSLGRLHRLASRSVNAIEAAKAIVSLTRFIRRHGIDIVHSNDGRVHTTWGVAAGLAGAKLLWHHRSDPNSFALRHLAPIVADHIVGVSQFALSRVSAKARSERSSVIRSPFDTSTKFDRKACRSALLAELRLPPETIVLGYVGTLEVRKRPVLFVDVIAEIKRRAPDLPIAGVLIGDAMDGLDLKVQERVVRQGLEGQVFYLGFRSPGAYWMSALDILLVTAVDEPFGRTLIEAMLHKTLVIASDSGGNPEAIEDGRTGIFTTPDDPHSFADAVLKAVSDRTLAKTLVENAHREAHERFGIRHHVDEIMRIYRRLLSGGH